MQFTISKQIKNYGFPIIWNSLPIKSDSLRSSVLIGILKNTIKEVSDFDFESDSYDILFAHSINYIASKLTGIIYMSVDEMVIRDLRHNFHRNILLERDHEKASDAIDYMIRYINRTENFRTIDHWIAPLCQTAYIMGIKPSDIIDGAEFLFGALVDKVNPDISADRKNNIIRRALIRTSIGFDGLIKELKPRKEDLLYSDDMDPGDLLYDACLSPLEGFVGINALFGQNNDIFRSMKRSLSSSDLDIDISSIIEVDKSNPFNNRTDCTMISSLYINTSDRPTDDVLTFINDPLFNDSDEYFFLLSLSLEFNAKRLIANSLFPKKSNPGYLSYHFDHHNSKLHENIFTLEEQVTLLDGLIENGTANSEIIDFLEIDDSILHKRKKHLPSSIRRRLFSSDLGL